MLEEMFIKKFNGVDLTKELDCRSHSFSELKTN